MRRIVLQIIYIFGLSVTILSIYVCAFFLIVPAQDIYGYQSSLLDKVNRLNNINEPKIILVGNSNLAFGIDSDLIEKEFKMPVVNLGLHGGLGNKFHEEIAKLNINEDDIVIICHTNYSDKTSDLDPELAWMTIQNQHELWKALELDDWLVIAKGLPDYIITTTSAWLNQAGNTIPEGAYSRLAFNVNGDNTYPRDRCIMTIEEFSDEIKLPEINSNTVRRINKLNSFCEDNKATLLIAAYPIIECPYSPSVDELSEFTRELSDRMNCKVISDYTDYIMDKDLFYDTYLHLNDEGAKVRTMLLITDLNRYFYNQE